MSTIVFPSCFFCNVYTIVSLYVCMMSVCMCLHMCDCHACTYMFAHVCECKYTCVTAFMCGQRTIVDIIRKMLVFTCRFVWTGSMLIFWYIPRLEMTNKPPGIPFFPLPFPFPCRYMTDIFCFYLGSGNFNSCSHICAQLLIPIETSPQL